MQYLFQKRKSLICISITNCEYPDRLSLEKNIDVYEIRRILMGVDWALVALFVSTPVSQIWSWPAASRPFNNGLRGILDTVPSISIFFWRFYDRPRLDSLPTRSVEGIALVPLQQKCCEFAVLGRSALTLAEDYKSFLQFAVGSGGDCVCKCSNVVIVPAVGERVLN